MPQKVLLVHALPPGVVAIGSEQEQEQEQQKQQQQQQQQQVPRLPSRSPVSNGAEAQQVARTHGNDAHADRVQQDTPGSSPIASLVQQLGAYSAAWGQQSQGGAMPPPLHMPQLQRAQSIAGGPQVLWWWPCRPLDRIKADMFLSRHGMLGLDGNTAVAVSVWGLTPTCGAIAAAGALHPAATPHMLSSMNTPAAAAAAGKPDDSNHAVADTQAQRSGHPAAAAAELAALAHERVPGTWEQLCSFSATLYVGKLLKLGPRSAVQRLLAYPGWHMLRAELVRIHLSAGGCSWCVFNQLMARG
jgi:hypothetical protein